MPTETSTFPQFGAVNQFTLADADGATKVVFAPVAPDQSEAAAAGGPSLHVSSDGSSGTYSGNQIHLQECPLGVIITVLLIPSLRTGASVSFSFLLPPLAGDAGSLQDLETIGVRTLTPGLFGEPGARTVVNLKGTATFRASP
jgi:hypothetical protein